MPAVLVDLRYISRLLAPRVRHKPRTQAFQGFQNGGWWGMRGALCEIPRTLIYGE